MSTDLVDVWLVDPIGNWKRVQVDRESKALRVPIVPNMRAVFGTPEPFLFSLMDFQDSGLVTESGVPIWTNDGTDPSLNKATENVYRRTPKVWAEFWATAQFVREVGENLSAAAFGMVRPTLEQLVPNPQFLEIVRDEERTERYSDACRYVIFAEGRELVFTRGSA